MSNGDVRRQVAEEIVQAIEALPKFHQSVDFQTYVVRADVIAIAREMALGDKTPVKGVVA